MIKFKLIGIFEFLGIYGKVFKPPNFLQIIDSIMSLIIQVLLYLDPVCPMRKFQID